MLRSILLVKVLLIGSALGALADGICVPASAGEILYNGIELADEWPPQNRDPMSLEPMEVPYLKAIPKVIPIDVGRQLFVDDFLIEQTDLRRVFHQAEKYSGNPVLLAATQDELRVYSSSSGVNGGSVFLLHGGAFYDPTDKYMKLWFGGPWKFGLARSKDAIHWERVPDGVKAPNDLRPVNDCFWLDSETPKASERLKLLLQPNAPDHAVFTSPDGTTWSGPVSLGESHDYSSFFYNPFRKVWVYSIKQSLPPRHRLRRYAEAKEFATPKIFDSSVFWISADKLDKPDPSVGDAAQIYSLGGAAYESLMLGMLFVHVGPHNTVCVKKKTPKLIDLKLAFSRDGFHWDRPSHDPFIPAGRTEGMWDKGYIHSAAGMMYVIGDKLYFPYSGCSGTAPDGQKGMYAGQSIGIATLRRDGFASMEADAAEGTLTTRPVRFSGKHLFVNADCPAGELRVEVLDEAGKPIAPFTFANSQVVKADKTLEAVAWKGGEDLSQVSGKPVRFRFQLKTGKLYSFWVSPDRSGASYGYFASGGPGFTGIRDTVGLAAYQAATAAAQP